MPGETQRQVIDRITDRGMRVMRGRENADIRGLIGAYRSAQNEILDMVRSVISTTSTPGSWNLMELAADRRQAQLFQNITQRLRTLGNETGIRVEQAAIDQFRDSLARVGYALDQGTPGAYDVRLPILPEDAIRALVNTPFEGAMFSQRIGVITDEMSAAIQNQLTRSMINGESMQQAAKRVTSVLGANNLADAKNFANRATTIARTEIMRSQNLAKIAVYTDNKDIIEGDPEEAWVWVVTPDDRLCPWCRRREGKTPAEIKKMAVGRDPWGKSFALPLHPHCRCTSYPKLKSFRDLGIDMPDDFKDDERGIRNDKGKWVIQPVETFDDWIGRRPEAA